MTNELSASDGAVIRGEFHTDGQTFVFRLADTPFSGVGATPAQAFEDLLRSKASAGDLSRKLRDLAREQRGEQVRAAIVRTSMAALIAFGLVGGALGGAAALAPGVVAGVVETSAYRLGDWLDRMSPETEERLTRISQSVFGCPAEPTPAGTQLP